MTKSALVVQLCIQVDQSSDKIVKANFHLCSTILDWELLACHVSKIYHDSMLMPIRCHSKPQTVEEWENTYNGFHRTCIPDG